MNNEEFEKQVEFIVNQQAQFAADIQKLQEAQARTQEAQERMREDHARIREDHARTEHSLNELVQLTTDGFKIVIDNFQHLSSKIDVLVDSQIRTDETVRNFAIAFNRHLIEGHNGA